MLSAHAKLTKLGIVLGWTNFQLHWHRPWKQNGCACWLHGHYHCRSSMRGGQPWWIGHWFKLQYFVSSASGTVTVWLGHQLVVQTDFRLIWSRAGWWLGKSRVERVCAGSNLVWKPVPSHTVADWLVYVFLKNPLVYIFFVHTVTVEQLRPK